MHFVVVRLSSLGDVVLTTGVLHYLHVTYGCTFSVITRKMYAPFFEPLSCVKVIHELPNKLSFLYFCKIGRFLARQYLTVPLVDLHDTLRTRILRFFWRAPTYVYHKYAKERRKFLYKRTVLVQQLLLQSTVPQRYCMGFVEPLKIRMGSGIRVPNALALQPYIPMTGEEHNICKKFQYPFESIAIHPYAMYITKMWPVDYWDRLITALYEKGYKCTILGKSAKVYHHKTIDTIYNYTNRTSIAESIALVRASRILITADSGLMHVASATGTPVIALFGPTVREWGFFPQKPSVVLEDASLTCRPCSLHGKEECIYQHECMRHIEPEVVLSRVLELLHAPPTAV